jgi:hypothetical protein
MITSPRDAVAAIAEEAAKHGIPESEAAIIADGIFGGLVVGMGLDEGAFLGIHGGRLPHLTRQALKAARRDVAPQPGERPDNI